MGEENQMPESGKESDAEFSQLDGAAFLLFRVSGATMTGGAKGG